MKSLFVAAAFLFIATTASAQLKSTPDSKKKVQIVETSCGQCQFALKTKKGCDLAVRIDGKAYFVEGTTIDEHGDAHAKDGFCEAIRMAKVQGKVKDDKFKVTYFQLLKPEEVPAEKKD
ncbi:hypothetical protein CAP36_00940 [Chitinophagaceae bacterium IBVUCB2]|nr:hypothetical protein CAP36_00940 [Chitinophagaceae bacterium IBVUCB2]